MKKAEIKFWRRAISLLKKGYGADCRTSDLDDFRKRYTDKKHKMHDLITSDERCVGCRAKETIIFIEDHIDLLKF